MRNALLQVDEYREAAKRLANAENWQRGSMSAEAAEKLYGKQVPMSASRMDKYKSCHFSYFLQYGLKARPRKPAGFQAPEYGTFVHTVLERVFRAVGKEGGEQKVYDQKLRDLTN